MPKSIDVEAHANPALGSLVLRAYADGYSEVASAGVSIPLLYLPIPVVLSRSLSATMNGTNVRTGFINWLNRNPELSIDFGTRMQTAASFTRESIAFGFRYGLLDLEEGGLVIPSDRGLVRKPVYPASDERGRALRLAGRLGSWVAQTRSPHTVFYRFGVTL